MALPLPRVVADVGPGGGIVTSMMGQNALTLSNIQNQIKAIEAEYAPITYLANARAKDAYSRLVGPQFVAKMLGNENIFPNFPNAQGAINQVTQAGLNAGQIPNQVISRSMNIPLGMAARNNIPNQIPVVNGIPMPYQNAVQQIPQQPPQNNMGMIPTDSYGNQSDVATPQQVQQFAKDRWNKYFGENNNSQIQPSSPSTENNGQLVDNKTVQQRIADFKATKSQGEETGKIRAKAIDDFDHQYEAAVKSEIPIKNLVGLLNDPVFVNMRNKVPLFQSMQLKALSKLGTPEEQQKIGQFVTSIKQQAASVVQGFKGRAMDKEFKFADEMKVNDNDTMDVAIGKIKAIEQYNELTKQMAEVSSRLIDKNHMNRGDALRAAGKIIDADRIRQDIEFMFQPPVTEAEIEHNMKKYGKTRDDVVKHLKNKGYKLEIELLPQYRKRK